MTTNFHADVYQFHEQYDLPRPTVPQHITPELSHFRIKFLQEELDEYRTAVAQLDIAIYQHAPHDAITSLLADALDALADLVYVAIGTAIIHGFPLNEAWDRVQHANMTGKTRATSPDQSKRLTSFDVVKLPHFTPPDHTDLVCNHPHSD